VRRAHAPRRGVIQSLVGSGHIECLMDDCTVTRQGARIGEPHRQDSIVPPREIDRCFPGLVDLIHSERLRELLHRVTDTCHAHRENRSVDEDWSAQRAGRSLLDQSPDHHHGRPGRFGHVRDIMPAGRSIPRPPHRPLASDQLVRSDLTAARDRGACATHSSARITGSSPCTRWKADRHPPGRARTPELGRSHRLTTRQLMSVGPAGVPSLSHVWIELPCAKTDCISRTGVSDQRTGRRYERPSRVPDAALRHDTVPGKCPTTRARPSANRANESSAACADDRESQDHDDQAG
jgi:hypothetical protein